MLDKDTGLIRGMNPYADEQDETVLEALHEEANLKALPMLVAIFAFVGGEDDLIIEFASSEQFVTAMNELDEARSQSRFARINNVDEWPTVIDTGRLLGVTPMRYAEYAKFLRKLQDEG